MSAEHLNLVLNWIKDEFPQCVVNPQNLSWSYDRFITVYYKEMFVAEVDINRGGDGVDWFFVINNNFGHHLGRPTRAPIADPNYFSKLKEVIIADMKVERLSEEQETQITHLI